ncbi:hypothetical protein [Shewanella sp. KCT]|uniref:phage tail terminator protein n=1 Tax=Shewanella sp. KCT TaxID=2569535 RepID=UPI0011831055|nr:hypothetical protein [Shewanella sp. KCT]TVP08814.1 hypothetical protein AYI87_20795 [Shewanella sp. KCT]
MQDIVALLKAKLNPADALWVDVDGLAQLSALDDKTKTRLPKLFVIELSEQARPDVRGSGPYLQSLQLEVGVISVMATINGTPGNLTPMRDQVRQRLFGWAPSTEHEPLSLAGGRLLKLGDRYIAWLDRFMTEYTADANQP